MRVLVEQYHARGFTLIQFNVFDADTLRDAQAHPERYENLQVRVCGWNVRWNDLPREQQDAYIRRAVRKTKRKSERVNASCRSDCKFLKN